LVGTILITLAEMLNLFVLILDASVFPSNRTEPLSCKNTAQKNNYSENVNIFQPNAFEEFESHSPQKMSLISITGELFTYPAGLKLYDKDYQKNVAKSC